MLVYSVFCIGVMTDERSILKLRAEDVAFPGPRGLARS